MTSHTITDNQTLDGARFGTVNPGTHSLRTWDDGFGPLWIYRESLGPVGIVRATSWEDAWECVVDEIMPDGDEADAQEEDMGAGGERGDLAEGYHWRGNGIPSNDGLSSPIAAEDLNGARLEPLTAELAEGLGIVLEVTDWE